MQKTAYEMRISDWSSDVCSSDLAARVGAIGPGDAIDRRGRQEGVRELIFGPECRGAGDREIAAGQRRLRGPVLARKRRDMVRKFVDRGLGDMTVAGDLAAIDGEQRRAFFHVEVVAIAARRGFGAPRSILDQRPGAIGRASGRERGCQYG